MFKLIIAGGRNFNDMVLAEVQFAKFLIDHELTECEIEIVSGGAKGADKVGEEIAQKHNTACKVFPAQWNLYGRAAGHKRNAEMAQYADGLLAFWNGESKGTKSMIDLATKHGLVVEVVRYDE